MLTPQVREIRVDEATRAEAQGVATGARQPQGQTSQRDLVVQSLLRHPAERPRGS